MVNFKVYTYRVNKVLEDLDKVIDVFTYDPTLYTIEISEHGFEMISRMVGKRIENNYIDVNIYRGFLIIPDPLMDYNTLFIRRGRL